MIQVRFTTFDHCADAWVEVPVAELVADGDDVMISGPHADWIDPEISIVDPESGQRVTRGENAERWATVLPFAYRSGDIVVEVTHVATAEPAGAAFHYHSDS